MKLQNSTEPTISVKSPIAQTIANVIEYGWSECQVTAIANNFFLETEGAIVA